jgi:hypothetical protein
MRLSSIYGLRGDGAKQKELLTLSQGMVKKGVADDFDDDDGE